MNNPWQRFTSQPWQSLALVALATVVIVSLIDYLLIFLITTVGSIQQSFGLIFSSPLRILLPLAVAAGIGALGVYIAEQFPRYIFLTAGSLWALVLCLVVGLALTGLLPLPSFLVNLSYPTLLGIMVGVFWKGRQFWR